VCPIYTKSARIIIKNTKECHFDTIFEYDLHSAVQYTKLFFHREIVNKFSCMMPANPNIKQFTTGGWANACYGHPNSCRAEACDGVCICGLGAPR
jgi:hypothetical protein